MLSIGDERLRPSFWARVQQSETGCWQWTGATGAGGYAANPWPYGSGESPRAHRMAYLKLVGPIRDGLVLDHLCRNRSCVNPDHLEPVTQRENTLRGEGPPARHAAATHCTTGHSLDGENLYTTPDGRRQCKECRAAANREWRARKAGARVA